MTNPSLVKHIKVFHTHEIEKFKCGHKGCQQLKGSNLALKQHKKWHFDIEEKKRKRDEQIAKEKERLGQEKERQNLKRKSTRKVKATQSSLAKLVAPIATETGAGSSAESGDSTESTEPMCE